MINNSIRGGDGHRQVVLPRRRLLNVQSGLREGCTVERKRASSRVAAVIVGTEKVLLARIWMHPWRNPRQDGKVVALVCA